MKADKIEARLRREGYTETYFHTNRPNTRYDLHYHFHDTKLVIVEGRIDMIIGGARKIFRKGDEAVIPRKVKHSAVVSREGCKYWVGQR